MGLADATYVVQYEKNMNTKIKAAKAAINEVEKMVSKRVEVAKQQAILKEKEIAAEKERELAARAIEAEAADVTWALFAEAIDAGLIRDWEPDSADAIMDEENVLLTLAVWRNMQLMPPSNRPADPVDFDDKLPVLFAVWPTEALMERISESTAWGKIFDAMELKMRSVKRYDAMNGRLAVKEAKPQLATTDYRALGRVLQRCQLNKHGTHCTPGVC